MRAEALRKSEIRSTGQALEGTHSAPVDNLSIKICKAAYADGYGLGRDEGVLGFIEAYEWALGITQNHLTANGVRHYI